MKRQLLVSATELQTRLEAGNTRVFDCRFNLADPDQGRAEWRVGHIPGAVHADLDRDLASPVTAVSGRHPLPVADDFAAFLARAGWVPGLDIVAYDAQGGAFAARLWWLMRYFGHDVVSLLDGGLPAWEAAGGRLVSGEENVEAATATRLRPDAAQVMDAGAVAAGLASGRIVLIDARDEARFAGKTEPIDPIAGHVPGAVNRPFQRNLGEGGRFRSADALRQGFENGLAGRAPSEVVHMCGSGVTACHNQFAMAQAGLPGSRLYVGSWSEWIRDPGRPVGTGQA